MRLWSNSKVNGTGSPPISPPKTTMKNTFILPYEKWIYNIREDVPHWQWYVNDGRRPKLDSGGNSGYCTTREKAIEGLKTYRRIKNPIEKVWEEIAI